MLKLGTMVADKVVDISGMLTILNIDMTGNKHYCFQPRALNPETKQPVDTYWLDEARVHGGEQVEVDLPVKVIGTHVEDIATGFNGIATGLMYHLNGCTHFQVKPKGIVEKTGEPIKAREFDIRRLKGEAIPKMTEQELATSIKETPSPESHTMFFAHG